MGNNISAEKSESMETITSVLEKLRNQVSIVDHAVAGLARAIDTLQLNCQVLEDNGEGMSSKVEAGHVLQKLQDLILDNKCVTVRSVANFLTFVNELVQRFIDDQTVTKLPSLEVNSYCQESQNGITQLDSFREYFIRRIDSLKLENSSLQSRLDHKGEELKTLLIRMQTYIDENELFKKEHYVDDNGRMNKNNETSSFEENSNIQGTLIEYRLQKVPEENQKPNELEEKLRDYQHKIETHERDNERLIEQENLLRSKDEEISTLKEAITELETKISQSKREFMADSSSNNGQMAINSDFSVEDLKEKMTSLEQKYKAEKENRQRAEAELAKVLPEYESFVQSERKKQRLEEEIKDLETRIEELKTRLEELKSKKKVYVQRYRQPDFHELNSENWFFKRLTLTLEQKNIEMAVHQLSNPNEAVADVILIGSISNPTGKKNKIVDNFLKECTAAAKKTAIVVYHNVRKNEDAAKAVAQFEKLYGSIITVFHVSHTPNALSTSELNTSTVNNIVKFIVDECGAKPLLFESSV